MWYINTIENITQPYKEIKILTYTATWTNLKDIMLS